jgi:DNA primase
MGSPPWKIDDVLARADLAALLDESSVAATHSLRGRRWHCPVPDHDDQHASVTMHTGRNGHERWRCWSGDDNHRGDAVDLVVATQGLARAEAIDWLAQRIGLVPDLPLPAVQPRRASAAAEFIPLDPIVVQYVEACERILWTRTGRPVLEWLNGRGFSDELLQVNRVGADPGLELLHRRRGLAYGASQGAVFPALDLSGEIAYVQTRYLDPGNGPKYDNPAGHLVTNPRIAWARTLDEPRPDKLIVCEGIPDALTAAAMGYRSVGVLGSVQLDLASADKVVARARARGDVVVNDHDVAGRLFADHARHIFESNGIHTVNFEPAAAGSDLNDYLTGAVPVAICAELDAVALNL